MPWSKRKPYIYDEDNKTSAGKIRSSLGDFFRAPVRYLKESNEKESQFEKPYQSGSYQKMHLDLPWSKFRRWEDPTPGSIFGAMPSLTHTFFFGPGLCSFIGGGELIVGEWQGVSGFRSLTPPQSGGGEWIWSVSCDRSEVEIKILSHGKSPTIRIRALAEFEGIALVCGSCGYSGSLVSSYTMKKAGTGFVDLQLSENQWNFIDRNTNLPVESSIETGSDEGENVSCGCVEFTCGENCDSVTPVTFLAYGINPETVSYFGQAILTAQDGRAPYNWSVSGSGFSISAVTEGLSNTLIASNACGVGTVTITDDCGYSDIYTIRCTNGSWSSPATEGCVLPGRIGVNVTEGEYKQESFYSYIGGNSWLNCSEAKEQYCEAGTDQNCLKPATRLSSSEGGTCWWWCEFDPEGEPTTSFEARKTNAPSTYQTWGC